MTEAAALKGARPTAMLVDGAGSVRIIMEGQLLVIAEISSSGRNLGVKHGPQPKGAGPFGVVDHAFRFPSRVACDVNGDILAVFDYDILARFSKEGNLLWRKTFGGFELQWTLDVNREGAAMLSGESKTGGCRLVKISESGRELWSRNLVGQVCRAVAFDPRENAFAVWNRPLPVTDGSVLCKLSNGGEVLWQKNLDYPSEFRATGFVTDLAVRDERTIAAAITFYTLGFNSPGSLVVVYSLD